MKLLSFKLGTHVSYGVIDADGVIDVGPIAHETGATLKEAIARQQLPRIAAWAADARNRIAPADVEFLPVIPDPAKILCVGINYMTHVQETGRDVPRFPMIFTRYADSQTSHLQPIVRPSASVQLDFEGELAVIIGRRARHVAREEAFDYIAGYACYNDGSVRDWQRHSTQFISGKNFPRTGAFGPWMVTADEIADPSALALTTRLNGEVMQQAMTNDLIFPIPTLIEYCSIFTELNPGDVIITGTTGGVGAFRNPPVWMKPGDTVEVEISGIGVLRNSIADEERAS